MTAETDLVLPRQTTPGFERLTHGSSPRLTAREPHAVREALAASHRARGLRPSARQAAEVTAVAAVALGAGWLAIGLTGALEVAVATAVWLVTVYHDGAGVASLLRPELPLLARKALTVLGLTAIAAQAGVLPAPALPGAAAAVLGGSVTVVGIRLLRSVRHGRVRTILVGDADSVARLLARFGASRNVEVVATCVPNDERSDCLTQHGYHGPVVHSLDAVPRLVRHVGADVVSVVPGAGCPPEDLRRLGWLLEDLPVHLGLVGLPETLAPHRIAAGRLGRHAVVELQRCRRSAFDRMAKALIDRVAGVLILLAVLPILGALTLAVRLDSRGPAFFTQRRVGLGGRQFTLYKFRTMHQDAEARRADLLGGHPEVGPMLFKLRDDPRITRVGRYLRRFSLDELPQLLNVVKGEMSLIGPRPALPEEVAQYDETGLRRLAVRPGLTGLWQVSGRSDLTWEDALALDLHYVDNWRLSDDAVILGRTVHAVLTSRGAY